VEKGGTPWTRIMWLGGIWTRGYCGTAWDSELRDCGGGGGQTVKEEQCGSREYGRGDEFWTGGDCRLA
jgi:hypothetical protein